MSKLYDIYRKSEILTKIYKHSWLSPILRWFVNVPIYLTFQWRAFRQSLSALPRKFGFKDDRFERLREFKDRYKGKRVFVTCTGPSLTISDLELLDGEYVFGMNSIALIHDETSWKPDFYAIQDGNVYAKIEEKVLSTDNGIVFIPFGLRKKFKTLDKWVDFHISYWYHMFGLHRTNKYFAKFSGDCYHTVYDGYSIAYSILQLAVYIGFDEIYLLGADCSYSGKQQHFIETGLDDPTVVTVTKRFFASYGEAKKFADKHGIKIYNATRGGYLEMFPRVNLEDVLIDKRKNKNYQ
ncbi:MAG: DUF115 domain-containing protein [Bacteroidales bacterium]|nr:DUF115 domain-containing protein [Bacteroidales bacterium]